MRIAFATCSALPDGAADDRPAAELLGAEFHAWDDPTVDWHRYDRVVLRSPWDYTARLDEFLAWCAAVGPRRLRNQPALVAFNADKRYLRELQVPAVPTQFIAPADPIPVLDDEVVVKPNVSAGARDTGRFGPATHDAAAALILRIQASGRVALVQPYLPAVERRGETALVFFGGELSHVLRKRPLLRPDEVAPVVDEENGVAAAMLDDDLVAAGAADAAERELAHALMAHVSAHYGTPLYARVDVISGPDGPLLLELEVIEPSLYLSTSPGAHARFAATVRAS